MNWTQSSDNPLDAITRSNLARRGVLTDEERDLLLLVFFPILSTSWTILGLITNTLNIIVFIKMGFKDTINLSLFAMAVSDMGSLLTLLWCSICFNPDVRTAKLPYDPEDMCHLTAGWPHIAFTRVTGWITAYVTFERYLCIARPLTVKRIITPSRVKIIMVAIFVVNLGGMVPIYLTNLFVWKPVDNRTRTILALAFSDDQPEIEFKANLFNQVASPCTSYVIVFVFSLLSTAKLRQKSKWRQKASGTPQTEDSSDASSKEMKVGKMIITISSIFIVCLTPGMVGVGCVALVSEFKWDGLYANLYIVCFSITFWLEGLNSSVNCFVYFRMSTNYRQIFNSLFHI